MQDLLLDRIKPVFLKHLPISTDVILGCFLVSRPAAEVMPESRRLEIEVHAKNAIAPARQCCADIGQQKTSADATFVGIERDNAAVGHQILGSDAIGGVSGAGRTTGHSGSNAGASRSWIHPDSISETFLIRSTNSRYFCASRKEG